MNALFETTGTLPGLWEEPLHIGGIALLIYTHLHQVPWLKFSPRGFLFFELLALLFVNYCLSLREVNSTWGRRRIMFILNPDVQGTLGQSQVTCWVGLGMWRMGLASPRGPSP